MKGGRELNAIDSEFARKIDPFFDRPIRILVANFPRRQLLERGCKYADLHEFWFESANGHRIAILMYRSLCVFVPLYLCVYGLLVVAQQSPAAQRPPQTVTPQSYPPELVLTGQTRFASECGFCHGRDAAGGETGPDLTRSTLVAEDVRGNKIGPLLRAGRTDKGMPKFEFNDADLGAIVAYIHDQKTKAEALGGGRRAVDAADLATGDATAGHRYFDGA